LKYLSIKKIDYIKYYALKIGEFYSDIKDKLLNAIQLLKAHDKGISQDLAIAEFSKTFNLSNNLNFEVIIDKKKTNKSILFFLSTLSLTAIIFFLFSNSLGFAFYRIINHDKSFLPPPPYQLIIDKAEMFILRGDPAEIIIRTKGKAPESINLILKENNQSTEEKINIKIDSNNTYTYKIQSIKNSLIVYGSAKWLTEEIKTEEIKINVIEKPLIKAISGNLNFPAYTRIPSKKFDVQSADLTALKGSRTDFSIMTNKSLRDAKLVFLPAIMTEDTSKAKQDTIFYNLNVTNNKISGGFNLNQNGTYYISITDIDGIKNTDPIKYSCIITNDSYPQIELLSPSMDVQLNDQAKLPVELNINDDYGFSSLKLYYRLIDSKFATPQEKYEVVDLPLTTKDIYQEISYIWDLNKINISPADKYEFFFEVADNDIITGPKTAKTKSLLLRLPSLDEVLNNVDEEQKNIENELKNVLKQAEEIKKDVDEVNKELLKKNTKKELDWKEKKKLDDAVKKQDAVNKKMQDLQKSLNEMTDKLEENKALSPETLEKYKELQKMMKEMDSPELKKLQEKMNQMMKQTSPEQMQKMMKDYKFDEEQFKKSIERTMKLLKRMQAEQKIDALTKRADEADKKLEELNKQMDNTNPNDKNKLAEMQKQQKNLQEDIKNIPKEMKELEKLMQDIGKDMPLEDLKKAEQELNSEQTKQEMQDAQKSTEKGDLNAAQKSQKNAQKKMQNLKNSLAQMKKKMQKDQAKEEIKKMQKAVNDMLSLSEKQEDLKDKTSSLDYNSTKFPELTEMQADLNQSMMNAANNLMDLSEKSMSVTPEMAKDLGDAMKQMNSALNNMSERNPSGSANNQQQAMSWMNDAIKSMQDAVSQMKNKQSNGSCDNPGGSGSKPSSGMSTQEQMQQLANQQNGINQAMQQMMQGGGQMNQEMRSQMGKLQNQQGQAQKGLEEIMKDQKKAEGGNKLPFGDLDKLNKDMQEVMTDLKNNHITPETMKRQEKILSRLLDYSRALNERDYEKNRESKTGKEYRRNSPNALDFDKLSGKDNKYQDLIKSLNAQYTKDYEELIRKYLEKVQKEN
jgi:hypothetical protein